jgi:succinylglutamate desuccinylase
MFSVISKPNAELLRRLQATSAVAIKSVFPAPTLIKIPGKSSRPLFVSILLHGNETSGLEALQMVLKKYEHKELPRPLWCFVGNVDAAGENCRFLDGQPDFNRIWNNHDSDLGNNASALLDYLKKESIFASIDIHNNTGHNPHYGCIAKLDGAHLNLAAMFNHIGVLVAHPNTTLTNNVANFTTAITLECGKIGNPHCSDRAFQYVDALLHLHEIPEKSPDAHDLQMYRSLKRIRISNQAPLQIGGSLSNGICIRDDLDFMNFSPIAAGTILGTCTSPADIWEDDAGSEGNQVFSRNYIDVEGGNIVVKQEFVPAMLTVNPKSIRDDCLGYVMQRL